MADSTIYQLSATTLSAINAGKGKEFAMLGLDFYVGTETNITAARADVDNWISRRIPLSEIDLIVGQTGPPGADGADGADGATGATGATGAQGPAGVGVPVGGTAGQALVKVNSTDFNTTWSTLASLLAGLLVPAGGTTGQVLKKTSNADGAFGWGTDNNTGGGGTATLPIFAYEAHGLTTADIGKPFWYDTVANAPVIYDNNDPDHWMLGIITGIPDDDSIEYAPGGWTGDIPAAIFNSYDRDSDGAILYWDKTLGAGDGRWDPTPPITGPSYITPQLLVNSHDAGNSTYNVTVLWNGRWTPL